MSIYDIIQTEPNGVMTYTTGNGSGDPHSSRDILGVDLGNIIELTIDRDLHDEVIDRHAALVGKADADAVGSIGDYRAFGASDLADGRLIVIIWE